MLKHLPRILVYLFDEKYMPHGTDSLKTRSTLLSKVRQGDEEGWARFYEMYKDFVYAAARGAGLTHEEAEDLLQETMITVQNYISDFKPDSGRAKFRTWLRTIVRSRIADRYRRKKRDPLAKTVHDPTRPSEDGGTSITDRIPDFNEVELDRLIDRKLEQAILAQARKLVKEEVRGEDYQAYDFFTVQGLGAKEVAASLGSSAVTVRVRAFRVRRTVERAVRRIVRALEAPKSGR